MNIEEAIVILNNSGKHKITKGSVFGDNIFGWQGLLENYEEGDKLTPRNSTLTLFFTEKEIIHMAQGIIRANLIP